MRRNDFEIVIHTNTKMICLFKNVHFTKINEKPYAVQKFMFD